MKTDPNSITPFTTIVNKASRLLFLVSLTIVVGNTTAYSQEDTSNQQVFELDPFRVEADDTQGYIATTAMTATKIGTAIKNTPLNVQVMTSEFLEDTAMLDFSEITKYSSSFSQDAVNTSNFNGTLNQGQRGDELAANDISGSGRVGISPPNGISLRAFPISNILRNGLPRAGNHSLKGVDRVEVVKGPVAIFFGQSQPSGAINYVTKRPTKKPLYKVTTRLGDNNLQAVELDANTPILDSLGARVLGSWQESDDWRYFSNSSEEYIGLVFKWDPTDWITVIVEGEWLDRTDNPAGTPIVTNPLYHNDYFNPPDEILFLPQDSEYGRNSWNRPIYTRAEKIEKWQQTILRNRDNWLNARKAAFPQERSPDVINQYFLDGVDFYEENRDSFDNALANVYGPGANFTGPHGYSNNKSEVAYYEVSMRPFSWLSFKASGNYGESARKFRLMGANMPYGDLTFAGTSINAGQQEDEFTNHIFDIVFSFDLFNAPQKIITGGELRSSETGRWRVYRSWSSELTQTYKYWDPRTAYYPPLDAIYSLKTIEPDIIGIFDATENQIPDISYSRTERLGSYVMHQGEFFNTRLHTMAGIRHESETQETKGLLSQDWQEEGTANGTSSGIGFVYEINNSVNVYASWNQNYRPNTGENIRAGDLGDLNQQDLNERRWLDDETGTGIDMGLKVEAFGGKLTGQFSYFETEREGIARLDYQRTRQRQIDSEWQDDDFKVRYYVNGGLERATGFETEILSTPLPGWQILFSYTYYFEADVISDPGLSEEQAEAIIGNGLPNVSKQRLSIWTNYDFPDGRLEGFSIGGGLRYASESKPFARTWLYDIVNDSYTVYDARMSYKFEAFKGDFKLSLNVKTVTDKFYSSGGLGFSPPRTWVLSLDYTY